MVKVVFGRIGHEKKLPHESRQKMTERQYHGLGFPKLAGDLHVPA